MPTYYADLSNKMSSTARRLDRNRSLACMPVSMLMPVLFGVILTSADLKVLFAEVLAAVPVWLAGSYRRQAASMIGSRL